MGKDINDDIPGDLDQLASSIKATSDMTSEMFENLMKNGMARKEAFVMTQTWLTAILAEARRNNEGK